MREEIRISYEKLHLSELTGQEQILVKKAREVSEHAYAPYSKFKVGASVLLENGEIITGSNQENIAYPSGLCAERVALFAAGSQFPGVRALTMAIVAEGALLPDGAALSPCGGCRQVMCESEMRQDSPIRIILVDKNDQSTIFYAATDLLPLTFGK